MTVLRSKNPLVRMIVDGKANPEVLDMLLERQLPFTDTEYLETLVYVIKIPKLKTAAIDSIKEISDSVKKNYVDTSEFNLNVAYFILLEALSNNNNEILRNFILNNHIPLEFLKKIAKTGNPEILEALSENLIRLIAFPEIIEIMEGNKNLNNYTKGKLNEIRKFYLTDEKGEEIKIDNLTDEIFTIAAKEEKERETKIKAEKAEKAEKEEKKEKEEIKTDEDIEELVEEVETKVLSRFQEINNMTVSERIKTALLGTQADRAMLIRDSNKLVSMAVIQSPKLSIEEICMIAKNKSINGEIITAISKKKGWVKSYQVMMALIENPKTPVSAALGFLRKVQMNDLRQIKSNRNVSPVIRKFANEIIAKKK